MQEIYKSLGRDNEKGLLSYTLAEEPNIEA